MPLLPIVFVSPPLKLLFSESLEMTVEDDDTFVNEFLGFVSILMGDLADKKKKRLW